MTTAPQAQSATGRRRHIQEMMKLYDQCAGDWCAIARHIEAETIETAAERDRLRARNVALVMALELAVRQNSHDMLMTGDELRLCQSALRATGA